MNTILEAPNFTDAMIRSYDISEPMLKDIRWSQLAALKFKKVPECIKTFI